jgi:gliding motility-associated-like protein
LKILIQIFFISLLLSNCIKASAQAYLEFVENKGQWNNQVKYQGKMMNGDFSLQSSGYRVNLVNPSDIKSISEYYHGHSDSISNTLKKNNPITLHGHTYEVKFLNANPNPTIIPEKKLDTYNNYFIDNNPNKWASNCKIFTAITYKNIYPNVDVRYYTEKGKLKYDIIVHPGGDVEKIVLYYEGVEGLKIKNEKLIVKTSIGEVQELAPYSFQSNANGRKDVPCKFEVKGNIVRFKIQGKIDNDATLVIDPTWIFSTFTGSTADNWGYTATYDAQGNFYAGGIVFNNGFPTSNGAYQTTFQGGNNLEGISAYDIAIIKFNPTGTNRIYATYLGGSNGNEQPHSLVVDNSGNLIIAGRTSSNNYPTTFQNFGSTGGWDIILTKLNATGTALIGSRKIGGSGDDGVNIRTKYPLPQRDESIRRNYGDDARSEVITDASGNILLASCTQSSNYPTTPGAAQTIKGATPSGVNTRYQDGVVIKTSPDLSNIIFSTFLGGNGDDAAYVLAINPTTSNIYVAGGTQSTDLLGDKTGTIFPNYQGGLTDGFITVLTNDGSQFLKTTYIGTNATDIVFGIQFDKFSYPYIMGTTTGTWPISNAAFNQPNGKQFIAKLNLDLSGWQFSTAFGTTVGPNISPFAFLVDRCSNIYVSGWGGGINKRDYNTGDTYGLPVTSNAIKPTTDGKDMYFMVLEKNAASLLYGSFFGQNDVGNDVGEHVDGGTSRFDANGTIYQSICANCNSTTSFPTTNGVWASTNGMSGNGCNLAAIKIAFDFSGVGSAVQSAINGVRDTSGCVPLTVSFRDTIANAVKYTWRFGDGSPDTSSTNPFIQHTYNFVGDYQVRLISIDSFSCNISDTSFTTLRVRNDDAILGFTPIKQLPCDALKFNFVNNSIPPANKPFRPNSFKWDFGDNTASLVSGNQVVTHSYAAPGTYIVRMILIDTNYCNEPDTSVQTIRVAPLVKAQMQTKASGCVPYNAVFTNTSLAGTDFIWDFGDGSPVSTTVNPTHIYASTGTFTIKLIALDSNTCNKIDSTFFTLTVSANPTSAFVYAPQPPVANTSIIFTNNSLGGNRYKWDFGDGDTLITTSLNTPVSHIYNATKTFNACLITSNIYSCRDTSCQQLKAVVVPVYDVPNAFTPNGDGLNDVVKVEGYGIEKMNWRIYNRWGTLVFSSTNKNNGWDGKLNNKIQPQDVYTYTLELEFTDGTNISRKGDISLLK